MGSYVCPDFQLPLDPTQCRLGPAERDRTKLASQPIGYNMHKQAADDSPSALLYGIEVTQESSTHTCDCASVNTLTTQQRCMAPGKKGRT